MKRETQYKKPKNNAAKEDVFRLGLFYSIKNTYQEKVADKIANSIFNEVIINRGGKVNSDEFMKIVEETVPYSNKKEDVIERISEQFNIYTNEISTNMSNLKDDSENGFKESSNGDSDVVDIELKSEGECKFCKRIISGRAMARHLAACADRTQANSKDNGKEKVFLIKAGAVPFWVYFEANASDTLEKVDDFLRDLWLECCGHLSAFHANGITYSSEGMEDSDDESMKIAIGKVLSPGMGFSHEYDFGTTTTLGLKCLSERQGEKLKDIEIITRNEMPDFKCKCGKQPKDVCSQCVFEIGEEALLCSLCAKKHECGEEMLLPVVNSPRMGMCGYTGD